MHKTYILCQPGLQRGVGKKARKLACLLGMSRSQEWRQIS